MARNKIKLIYIEGSFPFLQNLVLKSNETVQPSILNGTKILYLCHIDSPYSVSLKTDVGMELPVH